MFLVKAALGKIPLDTLVRGASLVNVLTGEIQPADIGVYAGKIVCVESPGSVPPRQAAQVIEAREKLAVPGLIDVHMHIESSLVTPARFAEAVLLHGTTTVAEDPHELANVLGLEGIRLMWAASAGLPLKVCFLVPTCVPSALGLETSGGEIGPLEAQEMLAWERVVGLAEVMDFLAVIGGEERIIGILEAGRKAGVVIEGHNPLLRGRELNAYLAAGIDSDHTFMEPEYMLEKLRLGVTVEMQERTMTPEVISALRQLPSDPDVLLVTDDVAPDRLNEKGHLDQVLRRAVELGMKPVEALRSATVKPARRLRLHDRGAIAPGKAADIVLVDSLESFAVDTVLVDGQVVVRGGKLSWCPGPEETLWGARGSVRLPPLCQADFQLRAPILEGEIQVRVIVSDPHTTATEEGRAILQVREGIVQLADDLAWIAVFERYGRSVVLSPPSSRRGQGVVRGLGLQAGAVATTYAHDTHNLVVIGRDPADMAMAANALIRVGGGLVVVRGQEVLALVELPIGGIMAMEPVSQMSEALRRFEAAAGTLGMHPPHLLMRLASFTLPVASGLRITDRGLVNARSRQLVDLFL